MQKFYFTFQQQQTLAYSTAVTCIQLSGIFSVVSAQKVLIDCVCVFSVHLVFSGTFMYLSSSISSFLGSVYSVYDGIVTI